jgi:hypothetical protein
MQVGNMKRGPQITYCRTTMGAKVDVRIDARLRAEMPAGRHGLIEH